MFVKFVENSWVLLLGSAASAYMVPALLGTWRAARRYTGFGLWSGLALFACVIGWMSLALYVITLFKVLAP